MKGRLIRTFGFADPGVADFGLAVALLAPVHASLLTRSPVKNPRVPASLSASRVR